MSLRVGLLAALVVALPARAVGGLPPLHADFDAEPLDSPIETGGALLGQPIAVDDGLSAIVRALPFTTPSLELSHAASGLARALRFEFIDSEEVTHGDLDIAFTFRAAQLDFFSLVYMREQGGSAQSFLTMELHVTGDVIASDASGEPAAVVGHYVPGVDQRVLSTFHLDAGTWDLAIDDVPVVTARAHGVQGRGIGGLLFGTHHQTAAGSLLHLDDIEVRRGDRILVDGFEQAITPADIVEAPQQERRGRDRRCREAAIATRTCNKTVAASPLLQNARPSTCRSAAGAIDEAAIPQTRRKRAP